MTDIIKHYQVAIPESKMKTLKAKSGKETTHDALTEAVDAYIAEPCAVDIAQKRRN